MVQNCDLKIKCYYSTEMISYALVTLDFDYILSLQNYETFYASFQIGKKIPSGVNQRPELYSKILIAFIYRNGIKNKIKHWSV